MEDFTLMHVLTEIGLLEVVPLEVGKHYDSHTSGLITSCQRTAIYDWVAQSNAGLERNVEAEIDKWCRSDEVLSGWGSPKRSAKIGLRSLFQAKTANQAVCPMSLSHSTSCRDHHRK